MPLDACLKTPKDFRLVFREPNKSTDPYFTVLARRNSQRGGRLGLAIAKKCAPRAVDRNRLKRLIRESFRVNRQGMLANIDVVVMCRRSAVRTPNARLAASLSAHWKRVRVRLCVSSSSP